MAFKFAIVLLCFVIVNNSVSQPPIAEVISDAFELAYSCYFNAEVGRVVGDNSLSKSGFLDFVGKEDNFELVNKFLSEKSDGPKDHIYLNDFLTLVSSICTNQDIDIKVFLKKRNAAAKLITYAFDIANGFYVTGPIRNRPILGQSEFLDFVGKEDNLKYVNSYWTANSVSGKVPDRICFTEFREVVYWICSKRELVVKDFLEERIPVAEVIMKSFNFALGYYENCCALNVVIHQTSPFPKAGRRFIRQSDFLDFLGKDEGNVDLLVQCVNDYWTANPVSVETRDKISFVKFREIMYLIGSKQQIDLKDFLEKRLAVAAVIKKAFDFVNKTYTKTEEKIIRLSDFLFFLGEDENNYLEAANSVLLEGKKELYMKDFKNILYLIFSNQAFVVKEFLEKRIALTKKH